MSRRYYEVKKTIFENDHKIYPENFIWVESSAGVTPLVENGCLEKTTISTPSSHCKWCGGGDYWLNFKKRFICEHCYSPESFPTEEEKRVYDTYSIGEGDHEGK